MNGIYQITEDHLKQFYPQKVEADGIDFLYDIANGVTLYKTPILKASDADLQKHIDFQSDMEIIHKLRCDYEQNINQNIYQTVIYELSLCPCNQDVNIETIKAIVGQVVEKKTNSNIKFHEEISQYMEWICRYAEGNMGQCTTGTIR